MSGTEIGYNSKVEGDVIHTRLDAAVSWFRKKLALADADGLGLLRD